MTGDDNVHVSGEGGLAGRDDSLAGNGEAPREPAAAGAPCPPVSPSPRRGGEDGGGSAPRLPVSPSPRPSARPRGASHHHGPGKRRDWSRFAWYALAAGLAFAAVVPFLYMISTSLMDELEVFRFPPPVLPAVPRWANYPEALTALPFARFFLVSGVMSVTIVAGTLFTSATAAYAFARLEFPGRERVFLLYLSTLMVPAIVLLIPRFLLVSAFGWVDTFRGLIVTELVQVWGIFLLRQYFLSLPRDLEDAARIDGASEWRVFTRVALPLARPALATVALFIFVDQWKSFLWPLIVTRSMDMRPVEVGISRFAGLYYANWPYQMAAAVVAILPILVLFFFAQRYFIRGIQLTGLKG